MKLREFVDMFICRNALIRLWKPAKGGYKMIGYGRDSVCMEWELVNGEVWQSKYNDCEVIGVKDIIVNDDCSEAVNIVVNLK